MGSIQSKTRSTPYCNSGGKVTDLGNGMIKVTHTQSIWGGKCKKTVDFIDPFIMNGP